MRYRVRRLVIKPTLICTANCAGCASRRELHRNLAAENPLSPEQWKNVLQEACGLGLQDLHISGGEPTLYPGLLDLIETGKSLGLRVRLNSNGSMITSRLAGKLLEAGLDEICISLYSHQPEAHNRFCKSRNLWESASEAVRILAGLRKRYPRFFLGTMSIILRENFRSFADLLRYHHSLGSQQMGVSYLEGDFSAEYLLGREEIAEFRDRVVPEMLGYTEHLDARIRSRARNMIRSLFSGRIASPDDFAGGRYWSRGYCDVPKTAGLIMANGDVHPCNIVEYTHGPVMGNLFEDSFRKIWSSKAWNRYRRRLHPRCGQCPVNIYTAIPLEFDPSAGRPVNLYHSESFAPFRPGADWIRAFLKRRKQRLGF